MAGHGRLLSTTRAAHRYFPAIVIILTFTAGTALLMWLGERVNEKGVGNGISIILFAGIVAQMPTIIMHLVDDIKLAISAPSVAGKFFGLVPGFVLIFFLLVWVIVFMNDAERRIPVQYAKRVVGRRCMAGKAPISRLRSVLPVLCQLSSQVPSLRFQVRFKCSWAICEKTASGKASLMRSLPADEYIALCISF